MSAPQFTALTARAVLLPITDVDTDQIIPARFLKVTDKQGLGKNLFCDWRYNDDGSPKPDFVLNRPESQGAEILVAGHNFGCGSSREHAPWALVGWGLRAVVSTMFADIFRNNSLKNGFVPVTVEPAVHAALLAALAKEPNMPVTVDLGGAEASVSWPGQSPVAFPIDPFARDCLRRGVDELGYLQAHEAQVKAYEAARA
ncbi:MAG: 3-isopropylmalate dehydratase small subunit [Candidatus Didemnitutus sp.]|nr:3-isopropylmalate dehydratase small subunit [Candidatus Didemnitutus sp.]